MENECAMNWIHVITIIVSILVPLLTGIGWIIHQIGDLKIRVAVVETILSMTNKRNKELTDP